MSSPASSSYASFFGVAAVGSAAIVFAWLSNNGRDATESSAVDAVATTTALLSPYWWYAIPCVFAFLFLHELVGKPIVLLRLSALRFFIKVLVFGVTDAGDGRELACLAHARQKVAELSAAASSSSAVSPSLLLDTVVNAIDSFAYKESFMMNVGDEKGAILDDAVKRAAPSLILELGCYVGYSALRMVRAAPQTAKVITVEWSAANAAVAREMFQLAGVGDRVTVVEGSIGDEGGKTLALLVSKYNLATKASGDRGDDKVGGGGAVDFLFLDHSNEHYLADFKTMLARGLFHKGSVVVADNILLPGAPDYLKYMLSHEGTLFTSTKHYAHLEYQSVLRDLVLESRIL